MGRVHRLTSSDVEKILEQNGFELVSVRGSHHKWRHAERRLQVVVPFHTGKTLPIGTLVAIMKGAEIPKSYWQVED